jgi:psiF repeat
MPSYQRTAVRQQRSFSMNRITRVCASIALALTLSTTTVFADQPSDKGKDKSSQQGHAGQQGKGDDGHHDDRYDDKGKDSNHGQVVSECNHRANERNLKGKDRKEWTEWCEERGSRHNYDYRRYSSDRNCYQKADNKGLTGDKRRKFINDCLDIPNRY